MKRLLIWTLLAVPPVLVGAMVWYATDRAGPSPAPGSILVTHYPELIRQAKQVLLVCWLGAIVLLFYGVARRRTTPVSERDMWGVTLALLGLVALLTGPRLPWNIGLPHLVVAWIAAVAVVGRERRLVLYAAMLVLGLAVPLFYLDTPVLWPAWRDRGSLQARDGNTYHVQRWQVLQAESEAFTQEISRGTLFLRTRVIGDVYGEFSSAPLVRPAGGQYDIERGAYRGAMSGPRRLIQSKDGRWILFIYYGGPETPSTRGCWTSLAYDVPARKLIADTGLRGLSPFILIGPSDMLNRGDLDELAEARQTPSRAPRDDVLEADLSHPNPRVREAVAQLLESDVQEDGA